MAAVYGPSRPPSPTFAVVVVPPNASWTGLPHEIKADIVGRIVADVAEPVECPRDYEDVDEKALRLQSVLRRELKGLLLADKASRSLCVPYLYQTVRGCIRHFSSTRRLCKIAREHGQHIRSIVCDLRPRRKGEQLQMPTRKLLDKQILIWLWYLEQALPFCPNLDSIDMPLIDLDSIVDDDKSCFRHLAPRLAIHVSRMRQLRRLTVFASPGRPISEQHLSSMMAPLRGLTEVDLYCVVRTADSVDSDTFREPTRRLVDSLSSLPNLRALRISEVIPFDWTWSCRNWPRSLTVLDIQLVSVPLADLHMFLVALPALAILLLGDIDGLGPDDGHFGDQDKLFAQPLPCLTEVSIRGDQLGRYLATVIAHSPLVSRLRLDSVDLRNVRSLKRDASLKAVQPDSPRWRSLRSLELAVDQDTFDFFHSGNAAFGPIPESLASAWTIDEALGLEHFDVVLR